MWLLSAGLVISWQLEPWLGLKECVGQGDGVRVLQEGVCCVIRVDVEEDWHVHLLPRIKPLLLEAEALNLVEVSSSLEGNHIVGRNPINRPDADKLTDYITIKLYKIVFYNLMASSIEIVTYAKVCEDF